MSIVGNEKRDESRGHADYARKDTPSGFANNPTRRPIIGLALAFIAGTWAGLRFDASLPAVAGIAAILMAALALLFFADRRKNSRASRGPAAAHLARTCCAYALFFVAAWINANGSASHSLNSLPAAFLGQETEMMGVVADEPVRTTYGKNRKVWKFPFAVEGCRRNRDESWQSVSATVTARWTPGKNRRFPRYGDVWILRCETSEFSSRAANGARPILVARASGGTLVSRGNGSAFVAKCLEMRAAAAGLLAAGIEDFPEAVAIQNSLLLGYRSQMPADIYRAFAATGVLHVFAISGSHVAVLAAIIVFVLGVCRIARSRWVLFLGPLLVLYTVMTGLQPSAVRACAMAIIYWAAPLIGRRSDIYCSLAAAATLILAACPEDIENIGFILSFAVVLGLALLYPVIAAPLARLAEPDPLRLQPEPRRVVLLRAAWKQVSGLAAMSVAAWIVSAPLTAFYFNIFSPVALIGNLIAIPLASLVIVAGSLSLLLGSCVGAMAVVFNHANLALVSLMARTIEILAALPGAYYQTDPPSPWFLLVFYALLGLLAASFRLNSEATTKKDIHRRVR